MWSQAEVAACFDRITRQTPRNLPLSLAGGVAPICPNSAGLADVDHGTVLWVRDGAAEYLMGNGRDVALTQEEKAQ